MSNAQIQGQTTLTNVVTGSIAYPGEQDEFSFSLEAPKRFYFDALVNSSSLRWSLETRSRAIVNDRPFFNSDGNNGNPLVILSPGEYVLTVDGSFEATGDYAFRLVDLAEATLISPGAAVTNGSFAPKWAELYQFTAVAGDRISLTRHAATGSPHWRLVGPYGTVFFSQTMNNVSPLTLWDDGTYVLLVESDIGTTATNLYSFTVNHEGNVPRVFSGVPLSFGQTVSSNLNAAATNAFTFNVPTATRLAFDGLTNQNNLRWMVLGPGGTVVPSSSFQSSIWNDFAAPAGSYQLLVSASGNYTNGYSFRMLDLMAGETISLDELVLGTNTPANSIRSYRIPLSTGQKVFLDSISDSGYTWSGAPYWILFDPNGTNLFPNEATSFNTQPVITATTDGVHTLLVGGSNQEVSTNGVHSFRVVRVTDSQQALALGAVVNGELTQPGQRHSYSFNVAEPTTVHFVSLTNAGSRRWTLSGPSGVVAGPASFNDNNWNLHRLQPGDYSLVVSSTSDDTGGYSFRLIDIAAGTPIALGQTVNGTLTPAKNSGAYRISGQAGQAVFLDWLSQSGFVSYGAPYFRMFDPAGDIFLEAYLNSDRGPLVFDRTGVYTMIIGGFAQETGGQGTFSFRWNAVTNGAESLALNAVVHSEIGHPGQKRTYTFTVAQPTRVSFDNLTNVSSLHWRLADASGTLPGANQVGFNSDAFYEFTLSPGIHTLTVGASGNNDQTGSVHFSLLDLSVGEMVAIDTLVEGQNIPTAATKVYHFNGTAGERLFFDALDRSGYPSYGARWKLLSPSGIVLFDAAFNDQGVRVLGETGRYTLLVSGYTYENTSSGQFSFRIASSPDSTQTMALNSPVTGTIAAPGERRVYTFTLPVDTLVYFDSWTNSTSLRAALTGPQGVVFSNRSLSDLDGNVFFNFGPVLPAGSYRLAIEASGDAVGGYGFAIMDLAAAGPLALGTTVNGTLSPANGLAMYRFEAEAGDRVRFQHQTSTTIPNAQWRLLGPQGETVWSSWFNGSVASNLLVRSGTHTLVVQGHISDPGSGSFTFASSTFPNIPPPALTGTPFSVGEVFSGTLTNSSQQTNSHLLTLSSPALLHVDLLRYQYGIRMTVLDADGLRSPQVVFYGDESSEQSTLSLPAGTYEVRVHGITGDYAFRLLDVLTAPALVIGSPQTNTVTPASGASLFRVTEPAGAILFYDGQGRSGFVNSSQARLYTYGGRRVDISDSAGDFGPFVLQPENQYYLALEGYSGDPASNGVVRFTMQRPVFQTNALALGQSVTNVLDGGGDVDRFTFTLAATNRLFFDVLFTEPPQWRWSLVGPQGTVVNSRYSYGSDSVEINSSLLVLPPGDYVLSVESISTTPSPYAFRLLDAALAAPFTLGSAVTTNLVPGNSTALFRFEAVAGQPVYYDALGVSGFNATPYARIHRPYGGVVDAFSANSDGDTFLLPDTGVYLMSVEGRYWNTTATGTVNFAVLPITHLTNTLALGTVVTNEIDLPGTRHYHTFALASPTWVFFDALSGGDARWTLAGEGGTFVNQRGFDISDGNNNQSAHFLSAGSYVLTVEMGLNQSGPYSFRLLTPSQAETFALDTVVTNVSSPSTLTRLYTLNAQAGTRVYFDGRGVLSGGGSAPRIKVFGPDRDSVLNLSVASDLETFVLPFTGAYILAHEGQFGNVVGTQTTAFAFFSNPVKPSVPLVETNTSPDLIVTGVGVVPAAGVRSGQGITVQWTVRNSGGTATAGPFTDRVIVRNTGNNQILVNTTLAYDPSAGGNGPVAPGGARSRQVAATLPEGLSSVGSLEVTVTTDAFNTILEQNAGGTGEANNSAAFVFESAIAPYPDLQVAALAVDPASGWRPAGQVTVSWAVTNTGNRFSSNSWSDRVLVRNLATSQTLLASNVLYDAALPDNGNLGPADFRARQITFTLPNNAQSYGRFEVTVEADAFGSVFEHNPQLSGETNNLAAVEILSAPDLRVQGLAVNPVPGPFSGARLDLSWQLVNDGTAIAENGFYERIRVVNTATSQDLVDTTPFYNGGSITNGTARSRTLSVNLPDGPQSVGPLQITVTADAFNNRVEVNAGGTAEANNSQSIPLETTLDEYPDLLVASVTVEPAVLFSGTNMTIRWVLTNSGTAPVANNFNDRVLVVNTNTGVTLLNTTVHYSTNSLGRITNGASRERSYGFTLPNNANGAGGLLVSVVADTGNNVFEFNPGGTGERNNTNSVSVTSGLTPLPDLAVTFIDAPATVAPGVPFTVSYGLTNQGPAAAVGPWNNAVLLSADNVVGFDQLLVNRQITNTLSVAGSLVVTQTVTIPAASESGPVYLVVTADSGNAVGEVAEANNSRITATPVVVPGALSLVLGVGQIAEGAANPIVTATVTRNGNRSLPLTVDLSSSDITEATVPATVTIPAGQASVNFPVTAQPDAEFDGPQVVDISASAVGFDPAVQSLTVLDSNQRRVMLSLVPTNLVEGASTVATITRDPVSAGDLVVQLSASDANQFSVPATVVIAAGMASTNVVATSVDDSLIERTNTYIVTATAAGHLPSSASVTVEDNDIPNVTLSLASRNVSEGAGPNATAGTVTLPSARPRNIVVLLNSSATNAARVPASVTIPSGALSASFPVSAVDNSLVDGPKVASIIGYVADSVFGQPLRATTPDLLTVTDDDGPTLRVFIADDLVPEGRPAATTGIVTRNTDLAAPLVVALASDRITEATVPASVTIPAGTNSASFNIDSVVDGISDGNQTVTITATAAGFTAGSDTVVVSDADLPDIIVTDLDVVTNGVTGQNLTVTFTLGNSGLRGANTNIVQRVLISTDPLLGSDTISAQPAYNGPLGVGDSIQQQATVRMPDSPGSYWIIVQADVFNAVTEVLENNNARVAAVPVTIGPAHSATVSTAVTVSRKGEPVPLTGSAVSLATGLPAPLSPVTVHVEVRGTRRTIQTITDPAGNFAVNFTPLPTEAGLYRIAATHPSVANPSAWQDQFSILGFNIESPGTVVVVEGGTNSASAGLVNLSDQPLTGLVAEVYTNHPSIQVSAVLTNSVLPGDSRVYLRFDVRAIDTSAVNSTVGVRVTTAEGLTNYLVFTVRQSLFTPVLAVQPSFLQSSMLLGHQTPVSFSVTNSGSRATGPMQILIPSLPWLSLSSPQQLPPLAPGSNVVVTLLLTPPPDLAFGDYTGSIAINSTNAVATVQYRFRTVSDGIGSLKVVAEDEYTYFTPDSPRVTNAWVRLTDGLSGAIVATNVTGADGSVLFTNLAEAYYIVDVGATAHSSYRQSAFVRSGDTTNVVAFLERQTVSYTFTVVPTTVEDRYRFDVETVFETQVPVPVVTISPPSVDLSQYPGDDFQIQFTIENHGLIEARDIRLNFPQIEAFQITPLITNIGTLGARQSITIPATVHRGAPVTQNGVRRQTDFRTGTCSVTAGMLWNYLCGPNVVDKENAVYVFDSTGCDLPALYNAVYELVPIAGGTGGGGGGPAPVIPADAGSNFSPPPGFKGVCRPAPLNIVVPAGRPGVARSSLEKVAQMASEVCARVKLKLSQNAVLTRDAFNATLEIENSTASPLSELLVTLHVQSADSTNATALFDVRDPRLVGMTGVDGTGSLPAFTAGSSSWILVPTLDAAPTNGARLFLVGGTLSYVQDGLRVTLPLAAAPIQVHPQPELLVRYFHDRDVFSDDPFTPEIEPSLPYSLAVRVENVGYGEARNMKITGGKPQIVENEKGLLIDFQILGTQLENQSINPALDVDLGPIGVGANKIARWLFTSSLQGSFTNYSASFEHLDAVAGKRLSLVRATEIHELTRIVDVGGAWADGRPDMLVNDVDDPLFLPDTLYLSQGPIQPVSALTNPVVGGPIQIGSLETTVTFAPTAGWTYLRFGNPGGSGFALRRVLRGDGSELALGTNVWTTDRFFVGGAIRPVRTNMVHLIDLDPAGSYTLVYASTTSVPDTTPPSTTMTALPAVSPADVPLSWRATDDISGVAHYDVYVSTNGGAFGRWASRLAGSGTVFRGAAGTGYAFYVLATDAAGNTEAPPPAPQASTTVTTAVNQRPVLAAIADQTVFEGELFSLLPSASDPDGAAQTLAFSLVPGTGLGALVDPTTGAVSWQTTGAHGGTTNLFSLVVTDNGSPSLSATQTFLVAVFEQNSAPTVEPSVVLFADEMAPFSASLSAQDVDAPAQALSWQLVTGAPTGLSVNTAGQILWTPDETAGPGTNFFSVKVTDSGTPALSATQRVTLVVNEVNLPPVVAPVTPKSATVGVSLSVTNSATDPDLPANRLRFSLGAGAPRGARIHPTNGVFTWTPTPEYASTTVPITVRVSDDGLPALVGSTTFNVTLGDFMGFEIGSAVVLTNETSFLPIRLTGTARVTNATAVVTVDGPVLAGVSIAGASEHLQAASLTPLGDRRYAVRLAAVPGGILGGSNVVAEFRFTTTNAGPSAIVPITVSSVTGQRTTGSSVDATGSADGRLVFIHREPVMELRRSASDLLTVFGRPGTGYEVQRSTNLLGGGWHWIERLPLTNRSLQFPLSVTNGNGFFRVVELGQPRSTLDLLGFGAGTMSFMLYGEPGATYDIQTSPSIAGGPWTTRQTVTLTVGYLALELAPPGEGLAFVRAVKR